MVKKKSIKEKLVEENEEEEETTTKSVILLTSSDDDEANEDLSLQIVEKARLRGAKRNRDDDEEDASQSVEAVINLSSSSCEELPDRTRDVETIGTIILEKKKKKRKKKKKSKKIPDEEEEETKSAGLMDSEEPQGTITSVEMEPAGFVETEDAVKVEETLPKSDGVEAVEISDNIVLRKLLRGPRYFDPPDRNCRSCYNCGEEGHNAINCTSQKRKKPCFICGSFEHGVRNCSQGQDCFICKKHGHRAKDCPDKHQINTRDTKLCLRCGDLGHLMFSCSRDYDPEDLKEIECYVCGRPGHLCCVDSMDPSVGEVSCYNCGQSGHYGVGCAKHRGEGSGAVQTTSCYKCGEEGHFARGCTNYSKPDRRMGESSTPTRNKSRKGKELLGHQSAPPDLRKSRKHKNSQYEEREFATERRTKRRGGWIPDDHEDLPSRKARDNGWRSPATPTQKNHKYLGHHPKSQSPWRSTNSNPRITNSVGAPYHGTPTYASPYPRYPVTPTSHPYQMHPDHRYGHSSGGGGDRRYYW